MNKSSTPSSLALKVLIGLFAFCLLIVLGIWIVGIYFLKPLAGEKIQRSVYEGSDQLYRLQFDGLTYNPFTGKGKLTKATLQADTARRRQLIQSENAPDLIMDANIPEVTVQGFSLPGLLWGKKLAVDEVVLDKIELTLTQFPKSKPDRPDDQKTPYQMIEKQFEHVKIGQIRGEDWSVKQIDRRRKRVRTQSIGRLSWKVDDILIDEKGHLDTTRLWYAKAIEVKMDSLVIPNEDLTSAIRVKQIYLSTQQQLLQIQGLGSIPAYPRMEYVRRSGNTSYTKAVADQIDVTGLDLSKYWLQKKVRVKSISLEGGTVNAFEVRNRSSKTDGPLKPFPHQLYQQLAFQLDIDSVKVKGIDIFYEELNPKTNQTGGVSFQKIRGSITGLSNDSLRKTSLAKANFQASFMGVSPLQTHFTFNMKSPRGQYTCEAELGKLNLKVMKPTFKPLALIDVESGMVDRFHFRFTGDQRQASGNGTILYHDLKVKILKPDEKKGFKIRDLFTFAANKVLMYESNPMPKKEVRQGKISYERIPGESFFGILWRSVRSCLSDSALKT